MTSTGHESCPCMYATHRSAGEATRVVAEVDGLAHLGVSRSMILSASGRRSIKSPARCGRRRHDAASRLVRRRSGALPGRAAREPSRYRRHHRSSPALPLRAIRHRLSQEVATAMSHVPLALQRGAGSSINRTDGRCAGPGNSLLSHCPSLRSNHLGWAGVSQLGPALPKRSAFAGEASRYRRHRT